MSGSMKAARKMLAALEAAQSHLPLGDGVLTKVEDAIEEARPFFAPGSGAVEPEGSFVVIAEFQNEAPIVMEASSGTTGYDAAGERAEKLRGSGRVVRTCIARLTYEAGNELLFKDLERMQK